MRFLSIISLCVCLPVIALTADHDENEGDGDAREDLLVADLAGVDFIGPNPELQIEPSTLQTITVMRGQNTPTVGFAATCAISASTASARALRSCRLCR